MKIGSWVAYKDCNIDDLIESGSVVSKSALIHPSLMLCHPIHLSPRCQIKNDVRIDKFSFINWDTVLYPNVNMGAYCSIGRGVQIGLAKHPVNWLSTHTFQYNAGWFPNLEGYPDIERKTPHRHHMRTVIGSDVWIGNNALIVSGIKIGNGAIIGAGALVSKDIPDYAIAVGVPAKVIRYRFDEQTIARLLQSKWWLKNPKELDGIDFSDIESALLELEFRFPKVEK